MPTRKLRKPHTRHESALMAELCQKHSFTLLPNKRGDRTGLMYDGRTKRLVPMYVMQLAVPTDSALGRQMSTQFPPTKFPPKKTP